MPVLTKAEICDLLPHGASMCLLDAVERWDASTIACRAASHRDARNPLRRDDRLGVATGLEYAAQAMGVHVGLLHRGRPTEGMIGYVGAVRDVTWHVDRLDELPEDLVIEAAQLLEGTDSFMYRFTVTAGETAVMAGRASLFLKRAAS